MNGEIAAFVLWGSKLSTSTYFTDGSDPRKVWRCREGYGQIIV